MTFIKKDSVISLFIGALSAFGFAPFSFPIALIAAYGWLFHKLRHVEAPREAFKLCYLWALGHYVAGLYWIGNSTLVHIESWGWAWPLAAIGLPALFALYQAVAGYLFVKLKLPRVSGIVLLFTLAELFRATWFTGFPWNLAGSTWIGFLPIAHNASWMGLYGLTAVTILIASALSDFKATYNYVVYLAVIIALYVLGLFTMLPIQLDTNTHVRVVQPNISQTIKWSRDRIAQNALAPLALITEPPLAEAKEHWIIWPETSQEANIWRDPFLDSLYKETLKKWPANTTLYLGMLYIDENDTGNALIALNPKNELLWRQNKHHLVPYGEYMPYNDIIPLGTITGLEGFDKGALPVTMPDGVIPLICYEIIFPHLARDAWQDNTRAIVTVTDDSWFGVSSGPYQHLVQARFRAIETGLPVLRSGTTGISAIIDADGRILARTQINQAAVIESYLPQKQAMTFYTHYKNLALYILLFGLFFIILMDKRHSVCNLLKNMG